MIWSSADLNDTMQHEIDEVFANISLQIGLRHVVDASLEEEGCSDCHLLVSVNGDGKICSQQKIGSGGLDPQEIFEMLEVRKQSEKSGNWKMLYIKFKTSITQMKI